MGFTQNGTSPKSMRRWVRVHTSQVCIQWGVWIKLPRKRRKMHTGLHTIAANTNLWDIFNFTIDAIIVHSSLNIPLNINWRAALMHQALDRHIKWWIQLSQKNGYILFNKLLYRISPKWFIMHSNSMPLSRFWQVFCSYNSLVKHAPRPNCKDSYHSAISQDFLHRDLANFSTYNCLYTNTT